MTEQKMSYPDKLEVQQKVQKAIERLLVRDCYLLEMDLNERSISHKLASYLQDEFGEGWHVDCEYNRDHDIKKKLIIGLEPVAPDDDTATTVFPDIIVHHRGSADNLLVIEMKKTRNLQRRARDFDLEKLRAFRQGRYRYCHTLYLQLKTGGDIGVDEMQWDGERVTSQDNPL